MRRLIPIAIILACAMSACAKKEVKHTVTNTVTVTVPRKPVVHTITVKDQTPPKRSALPPPPAGVFQVGDKRFLIRPGFEANMHHLCEGTYNNGGESPAANYVEKVSEVNGDFIVTCVGTIGKHWADLPFTAVPQKKVPVLRVPSPFPRKKR